MQTLWHTHLNTHTRIQTHTGTYWHSLARTPIMRDTLAHPPSQTLALTHDRDEHQIFFLPNAPVRCAALDDFYGFPYGFRVTSRHWQAKKPSSTPGTKTPVNSQALSSGAAAVADQLPEPAETSTLLPQASAAGYGDSDGRHGLGSGFGGHGTAGSRDGAGSVGASVGEPRHRDHVRDGASDVSASAGRVERVESRSRNASAVTAAVFAPAETEGRAV